MKNSIKTINAIALLLMSFLTKAEEISLAHKVILPEVYSGGCEFAVACESQAAAYVDAFERGWWSCVYKLSKDLDYELKDSDYQALGGYISIIAVDSGCTEGKKHIEMLKKKHDREKLSEFLRENVTELIDLYGSSAHNKSMK